jgi:Ca-activated chloride channel homolog
MPRSDHRAARRARCLVLIAGVLCAQPAPAAAQGWIEPRPRMPRPVLPPASLVEKLRTQVTVEIADRVATVEVEEWFRNNGGGLGEGDYIYPLPAGSVFASYSLFQGEQELRGELMDADRARSIYEEIVRAQRDPALIELVGKGMLRARVFPIEAGQTRRIRLRYTQVLPRAGDALHLQYAAGAARGTRTQEHAPLAFIVRVADGSAYRDAFSPTHPVTTERARGTMTVRPRQAPTGDFALFLPFAERIAGVTVAAHRPPGEDGYLMLTLSPGAAAASRVPRDVTAVVDVSGSMSGEKMEQARRALHQLLGSLGREDRVRLIAFSSQVRSWREEWTAATPQQLRSAAGWVDELRADGGTNIHEALARAFDAESPPARLPIVVFLTDGLPTVGETNVERITGLAESRRGRARVFALGVGYDVNTALLDRLSEAARGTTQYVRPSEDVEHAVSVLAARIRHPVLTDLQLNIAGATVSEVYPHQLPDLFAGEDLVIFGRYRGAGAARITVEGRREGRTERLATRAELPRVERGSDYIATLWAARKIGDLDRRIRSAQADGASRRQVAALIEELRETALRYGLLSEHTSYLVQEPVLALDRAMMAPAAPVSGQAAVLRAEESRRSREVASVADMQAVQTFAAARLGAGAAAVKAGTDVRTLGGRTFRQRNGEWHDAAHVDGGRVESIEPYSAAFFAVLRALPELAPVVRELDHVLVAGSRTSIRVAAGGRATLSDAALAEIVAAFRGR